MVLTKEQFKELVETYQAAEKMVDKFSEVGLNLYETDLVLNYEKIFDFIISNCFNAEGADMANWWLYEKHGLYNSENYQIEDSDGNVIPTDTLDELWDNFLKDNVV